MLGSLQKYTGVYSEFYRRESYCLYDSDFGICKKPRPKTISLNLGSPYLRKSKLFSVTAAKVEDKYVGFLKNNARYF